MPEGESDKERSGPVLRIAALLAAALALAAVIAPRLSFSGAEGVPAAGPSPAATAGPAAPAVDTATALPSPLGSTTPHLPFLGDVDATPNVTAAAAGEAIEETDRGEVTLALAGLHAGREGPRCTNFYPDDRIGWHFQVINSGEEYLWGVFVYLEFYGPVACSARRLDVGEAADCWAETWAQPGANTAEAWVTAWTTSRMVFARLSYRVAVAPV